MRGQQLSEALISALLDPPPDQRDLVRHYTLCAADLAAIRRCRGDHNRLGHALMLCYLRYPGRPLRAGERPSRSLLLFIAEQIDALPEAIEDYLAEERNRQAPCGRTAGPSRLSALSGRVLPPIWPAGCPVEYALPRTRHCRFAPGRECPGPAARPPLPARLGACEPYR
jgi:hypothetical protein